MRDPEGAGGTGGRLAGGASDGVGGTWLAPGNGLSGTGRPGGKLRLLGMVTGFGSVCVNGVEVHYSAATPVRIDGQATGPGALAVGQVIDIEVDRVNGQLLAHSIRVRHQIEGIIDRIDTLAGRVSVGGQVVDVPFRGFGLGLDQLRVGETVAVSGLRRLDGGIHATRTDPLRLVRPGGPVSPPPLKTGQTAVIQGLVERAGSGRLKLVDMPVVRVPADTRVRAGALVTVLVEVDDAGISSRAMAVQDLDDLTEAVGHPEPVDNGGAGAGTCAGKDPRVEAQATGAHPREDNEAHDLVVGADDA